MKFTEAQIQEIADGKRNGEAVWIADLRFTDYANKPIRNVQPTEATITSITETNKKIFYSESFFKVGKNKVVPLYDNTGYRGRTGDPVSVFDNEKECLEYYLTQIWAAKEGFEKWIERRRENFENYLK